MADENFQQYFERMTTKGVTPKRGIPKERSWIESVLDGLDYAGNISRSGMIGGIKEDESALENMWEAAKRERYTSPEELKHSLGGGNFGKVKGKLEYGDVLDFFADAALDIATDPITWFTFGLSGLGKKGITSLGKGAQNLRSIGGTKVGREALDALRKNSGELRKIHKGKPIAGKLSIDEIGELQKSLATVADGKSLAKYTKALNPKLSPAAYVELTKAPKSMQSAAKYIGFKQSLYPAFGALYGLGTAHEESGAGELLARAAGGAALGKLAPKVLGGLGKGTKAMMSKMTDGYFELTRPAKFTKYKDAWNIEAGKYVKNRLKRMDGWFDKKASEIWRDESLAKGLMAKPVKKIKEQLKTDYKFKLLERYRATNPLPSVSEAYMTQLMGADRLSAIAMMVKAGREEALEGLGKVERGMASEYMHTLKNRTVQRRNELLSEWKSLSDDELLKKTGVKKWEVGGRKVKGEQLRENLATIEANKYANDTVYKEMVGTIDKNHAKIIPALEKFRGHNRKLVKMYNDEMDKGLIGLDWHIDDVFKKDTVQEFDELVTNATASPHFKKKLHAIETEGRKALGEDLAYSVYADQFSKKFMSKREAEAAKFLGEVVNKVPEKATAQSLENALKKWDKFTNWMKMNMLMFNITWIKNNYMDNLVKTYTESGLVPAIQSMFLKSGVGMDVWKSTKNMQLGWKPHDPRFLDMLKYGALEGRMFDVMTNPDNFKLAEFMWGPKKASEFLKTKKGRNMLEKGADWWMNFLSNTTGRIGSHVEGTARAITYNKHYDALVKSSYFDEVMDNTRKLTDEVFESKEMKKRFANRTPEQIKAIKKETIDNVERTVKERFKQTAADVTKNTFFDYKKASYFEQKFFKRIMPFYTFYSRNIPYWIKAMFDPEKVGRLATIDTIRQNIGRPLTNVERQGVAPYILAAAPRATGRGPRGLKMVINPYMSWYDAVRFLNPRQWGEQIQEKLHPIPRTAMEYVSLKDYFTKGALLPSMNRNEMEKKAKLPGHKALFSRGAKYKYLQDALVKLGAPKETLGLHTDAYGNISARSRKAMGKGDVLTTFDKLMQFVMPMGAVEKVLGAKHKVQSKRETLGEAIFNIASPYQSPVASSAAFEKRIKRLRRKRGRLPE